SEDDKYFKQIQTNRNYDASGTIIGGRIWAKSQKEKLKE
ncbi:hypothetical protein HKBW3S42_00997, partial [Candidatus Hakubella thermalkaliphila]